MLISGNTTKGQVDKLAVFREFIAERGRDQKNGFTNYTNTRKTVCQRSLEF